MVDTIGNHTSVTFTIPTDKVYMHRDGTRNSLGIGKYVEEDNVVDVAEGITVKVRGGLEVGGRSVADFVVEQGTKNGWTYRVWKSGVYEMFGIFSVTATVAGTANGNMYHSEQFKIQTPFRINNAVVVGTATNWFIPITGGVSNGDDGEDPNENIGFRLFKPTSFEAGATSSVRLHVSGKLA